MSLPTPNWCSASRTRCPNYHGPDEVHAFPKRRRRPPVITAGRIDTRALVESILAQRRADWRNLRLGSQADWRLPKPDEVETATVLHLMMPKRSRDVYARFGLYWSSNPAVLLPFNYRPSYGGMVQRAYPAREGTKAFIRVVRSLERTP